MPWLPEITYPLTIDTIGKMLALDHEVHEAVNTALREPPLPA